MGKNITAEQVQQEWKDISVTAYERAEKTNDQFNKDLRLIGAGTAAIAALLIYAKPDLIGLSIATTLPICGAIVAHIKNYKKEQFYKAFASHALDMRDAAIEDTTNLSLPRIDEEIQKFEHSDQYKAPSTMSCIAHFRTAIIGMTAGTAITVVGGFSDKGYDLLNRFRDEKEETSQSSEFAPSTSPRPAPRPMQN